MDERASGSLDDDPFSKTHGTLLHITGFSGTFDLVVHFRRDVKSRFAAPHAAVLFAWLALLLDFHVDDDVEFFPQCQKRLDVLPRGHAVNSRPEAGTQEGVIELLADDGVIRSADAKNV